ncbi:hypothetical protein [Streptomyces synnematoformans]|uniref:Secreted protein n=1 Tax=Streptomyces synnematoformans TaxID=415721 RepID=A0ABP5J2E8_9ACTN
MWSTLFAVLGTLAGVALASGTQILTDRRTRAAEQRQRVADAGGAVLDAVLDFREQYWLWVSDCRRGEADTKAARVTRYRTRTEVTKARNRLARATADPALTAAAEEAAWSAIELSDIELGDADVQTRRFSDDVEAALAAGRERTRVAHTALLNALTAHIHRTNPTLEGTNR